jgi:hypothetical protein
VVVGAAVLVSLAIVAGVAVSALVRAPAESGHQPLAERVSPLLPDLTVNPIGEINAGVEVNGTRRFLNFGVMLVNIGDGDFHLRARRSHPLSDDWRVVQLVAESGGGHTETQTAATMVPGGDGHDHWHIRDVESHQVEAPDGTVVGRVAKEGFCFFDTDHVLPELSGSPPAKVYRSAECGGRLDTTAGMGLSVGWGDDYPWHLLGQSVDITNLPDGEYRVRAVVDPFGWFDELDETNNEVWTDIAISTNTDGLPVVEVLRTSSDP